MEVKIDEIAYRPKQEKITIMGTSTMGQGKFVLRKRRTHRDFEFPLEFELEVAFKEELFQIDIDLQLIIDKQGLNDEATWLIYMVSGENEYLVKVNNNIENKFEYFYSKKSIFKLVPYITKDKILAFYVRGLDLVPVVKNMDYLNGNLSANIFLSGKDSKYLKKEKIKITFKRRNQVNMPFHDVSINTNGLPVMENTIDVEVNISERIPLINKDKEVCWDVLVSVYNEEETEGYTLPLQVESSLKKQVFRYMRLKANNFFYTRPYITGDNRLAIYQSDMVNRVQLEAVVDNNEFINVAVDLEFVSERELSEANLVIKRRERVGNGYEYYAETLYKLENKNEKFTVQINKKDILNKHILRDKEVWDFFVRVKTDKNNESDLQLDVSKQLKNEFSYFDIKSIDKSMKAKLFINGLSKLSLYVAEGKNTNKDAIKVAVLGTCFSRNAFNSSPYFNPNYKKIYNCVYTQFHSSIISLVSNPVPLTVEELTGVRENDKNFVAVDFDKSFFDKLKESQADYLILDLYSDASKAILRFNDDRYVSCSYILEDSSYINQVENVKIIDHSNQERYFDIWKDAVEKFIKKLTEILPEERIILNKGRFTSTYFDENREIKSFSDPQLIHRNNYFWDKLDNYFMYLMPGVKFIDLTDTSYIGDATYPFGTSFSHYESGYYKEFLNRLNNLVIPEQLNK
ncbi:DUF6270 domain-containing protein [Bacillus gaemokensis]|uniref:DUF6270 domain-containing protein n=1 Tax=Bacillus gaemokensis TaxID=574375 RepID=UPI00068ABDAE|nr:DUF6270 domain-containing protein [Bacillus gaemokensis]KYG37107.1 hypothetical protein AZF08_06780 [Bacillus gaemokensis]